MSTEIVKSQTSLGVPRLSDVVSVPTYGSPQLSFDGRALEQNLEIEKDKRRESSYINPYKSSSELKPPSFWSEPLKEKFESLTPDLKKAWLESFAITEKSFKKMAEGLRFVNQETQGVMNAITPHLESILKTGYSLPVFIGNLLKADKLATNNPVEYVLRIMGIHRLKFEDLQRGLPDAIESVKMEEKLEPIVRQVESLTSNTYNSRTPNEDADEQLTKIANKIEDFYAQTDEHGNLLYPNAEQYYDEIIDLLREGTVTSLDEAYSIATKTAKKVMMPSDNIKDTRSNNVDFSIPSSTENIYDPKTNRKMLRNLAKQLEANYI
ncbi:MAG: hypothetical protein LBD98_03215 [Endomicrobium sp.]|jgi:hypothetical protein|nr:hypothetical protein [Endomicrobium sp.]